MSVCVRCPAAIIRNLNTIHDHTIATYHQTLSRADSKHKPTRRENKTIATAISEMSNSKIKSPRRPSAFDDALAKPLLSGKASTPNAVRSKAYSFRQLPPQTTKVSQTGGNATAFAFAPPDSTEDVAAHIGDHSLEIQAVLQSGQDLESALARERHTEITGINGSMRQINEIYRDLSSIVDEQQEDIDDMEENAAETHEQAGNGLKHLQKASKLNKASNKLILIFLTVFALIVTGAVLFIVFR